MTELKAFQNYYLVSYHTRDGEREYGDWIVVKAKDLDDAGFIAQRLFVEWTKDPDEYTKDKNGKPTKKSVEKEWEEGYLDLFETHIEIDSISPVLDSCELETYRKVFWIEN